MAHHFTSNICKHPTSITGQEFLWLQMNASTQMQSKYHSALSSIPHDHVFKIADVL